MKHPAQEEWMDYLYNEAPANERAKLSAHLAACPECRERVQGWQQTMTSLDTWQPAVKEAPAFRWMSTVRWAAAAMLMLGFGFALSQMTAPKVDVAALQAQVRAEVTAELKQQMQQNLAEFNTAQAKQRVDDTTAGRNGDRITIDGANVIASVRAGNGIVHVIDAVLLPK